MHIDDITFEDFRAYERVRRSGATNMANRHAVALLAGLTDVQVEVIQRNYRQLLENARLLFSTLYLINIV